MKRQTMNRCFRPRLLLGVMASLCSISAHAEQDAHAPGAANAADRDGTELPARVELGLGLRFMPIGWFDMNDVANRDFRAYPALGFAPFVDYRVSRYFSAGFSPEVTLNVIPNRSDYHRGDMLTPAVRLQARYPGWGWIEPYAIATGGYSIIWRSDASSASGPVAGGALGLRLSFARRHAAFAELGYQKGFQRVDGQAYGPSYLLTGAGWQVGF